MAQFVALLEGELTTAPPGDLRVTSGDLRCFREDGETFYWVLDLDELMFRAGAA